ncbi:hypothetical protein [Shinella sedimenti]|uniref:Uncharacterized protein n=1 Tax=Shinella sedimenti TaxID=2919913 RepID=A0ABT0CGI6_9HYPH|nr:hypothetical protein [Shinella sedimenti]MCJ8147726.1 hypothetical protein [Shinella sedimenti]
MIRPGMMPKDQVAGNGDRWNSKWRTPPPSAPSIDWQHSSSQLPININDARWISSPSGRYYFTPLLIRQTPRSCGFPAGPHLRVTDACIALWVEANSYRIRMASVYQCGDRAFFGQNFVKIFA